MGENLTNSLHSTFGVVGQAVARVAAVAGEDRTVQGEMANQVTWADPLRG